MKKYILLITSFVACSMFTTYLQAAVVNVDSLYAHNNTDNFGGNLNDLITGEEMTKGDANDPSTWTLTSSNYQAAWQAQYRLDSTTSHNSKIGWAAMDFGSSVSNLDSLYIWNLRDGLSFGNNPRAVDTFNIYYSNSPITAFPATPTASGTEVDYSFTGANGWTLFNVSPYTIDQPSGTDPELVIDLLGIDARYLAIEILTAKGGGVDDRVGLNEMAVTAVPEPSAFALLSGISGLTWVMLKRRR